MLIASNPNFYPRSPCGARRRPQLGKMCLLGISIHALLAESDKMPSRNFPQFWISIHALLAESDASMAFCMAGVGYFYPRSPCGERLCCVANGQEHTQISIHALLAESDLSKCSFPSSPRYFYPRSPCGERPITRFPSGVAESFLSTLSLRRATDSLRHR